MRVLYILTAIVASFLFYSCATPVFSLKSSEKDSDYYMGREYVEKVNSSARVTINFEDQDRDMFVFWIKVKGLQDSAFIFDPGEIYAEIVEPELKNRPDYKMYALNPETEIDRINQSINSETARNGLTTGAIFIAAAVDVVHEIATIGKDKTEEEVVKKQIFRENYMRAAEENDINYQDKITSLNDEKNFWQNNVLRKTTVYCMDKVQGYFYLPYWTKTELFRIVVPVGEKKITFLYKQIKK